MLTTVLPDVKGFFNKISFRKKYHPVNTGLLEQYNRNRPAPGKLFCHAPFTNIYFGRYGSAVSCCHNRKHIIGKYPEQSISDIWNGEKLKELREYIRHNDLNAGCHICKWDVEQKRFPEVKALYFDANPLHGKFPSMMEFELDNTCNLECTMCSGEFSSSIRQNREKKPPVFSGYDREFVKQLKPFIPHLREARFSGGEPFLIDIYYEIWENIIALNPDCIISVQSNGTVLNNRVRGILEKGKFEIGISLDSLQKATFENIRKNARFESVMEHTAFFAGYCGKKNTRFRISVCAMRDNWRELPSFVEFCTGLNAFLQIHTVWFPPQSSLWNLDKPSLQEIHAYLESFRPDGSASVTGCNRLHYAAFVQQVSSWSDKAVSGNEALYDIASENIPRETIRMKEILFEKIKDYILKDETIPEDKKNNKVNEIITKAENVFVKFNGSGTLAAATRRISGIPVEILVTSLQIENEERIYEQARAFMKE